MMLVSTCGPARGSASAPSCWCRPRPRSGGRRLRRRSPPVAAARRCCCCHEEVTAAGERDGHHADADEQRGLALLAAPAAAPRSRRRDEVGTTRRVMPGRAGRAVALRATASVMAPSSTAPVLRLSIGIGSTAKTLEPLTAALTCFLGFGGGKHQHDRVRRLGVRQLDIGAYVGDVARIDDQHLSALGAARDIQRAADRVDGPHGGLSAERFAELEQEVVARGDRGDDRPPACWSMRGCCRRNWPRRRLSHDPERHLMLDLPLNLSPSIKGRPGIE